MFYCFFFNKKENTTHDRSCYRKKMERNLILVSNTSKICIVLISFYKYFFFHVNYLQREKNYLFIFIYFSNVQSSTLGLKSSFFSRVNFTLILINNKKLLFFHINLHFCVFLFFGGSQSFLWGLHKIN